MSTRDEDPLCIETWQDKGVAISKLAAIFKRRKRGGRRTAKTPTVPNSHGRRGGIETKGKA